MQLMTSNLIRVWRTVLLALGSGMPVFAASAPVPSKLATLDAFVEKARHEFDVPGIAVAIIKDDQVVLERGYGVRKLGEPAAVDAHTLFAIASNTKAFTTASLAIEVDQGKLNWNDKVTTHLPWFAMSDAYVTHEMSVRDLLVHRSGLGLGAGDLLFWPATTYTTEEVVQHLRHVPLSTSFRSEYAYDNILYAAAGLTLQQVSGETWSQFVREHIFVPLGMSETKTNCSELRPGDNVATGHAKFDFKTLHTVPALAWDNNSAAGGIYSNVHDMAKWIRVQLAEGVISTDAAGKQQRLFSADRQHEMWALTTPIPIPEPSVPALAAVRPDFLGYGLGWGLSDYRGHKLVSHTGGWPGQVSRVTLVPDLKLGIVVLTNQEIGAAFNATTWRVLDAYLDAPDTDWVAAYAQSRDKAMQKADDSWSKHLASRDGKSRPSLAAGKYAGAYHDAWYGDVAITAEKSGLVMRFAKTAQLVGDLQHWQHDSYIVHWRDRSLNADAFVNFSLTADGAIDHVTMQAVSPATDFSFDFQDLRLVPTG